MPFWIIICAVSRNPFFSCSRTKNDSPQQLRFGPHWLTPFCAPLLLRSIFASCDKDWQLRIYKTAGNKLIRQKVIQGMPGQWTITDHNLSLDNDWLIYSSITPYVYLTRTGAEASGEHHQLDFSHDRFKGGVSKAPQEGKGMKRMTCVLINPIAFWINRFGLCDSQEMEEKLLRGVTNGFMVSYEKRHGF